MRTALLGLLLACAATPALAGPATTWLVPVGPSELAPESRDVAAGEVIYEQPVRYEGVARLVDAYQPGDGEVAAGAALFQVDAGKQGVFFCNNAQLRTPNAKDVGQLIVSASLFGLGGMPSALGWQCFQDKDGDGAFETVAAGARRFTATADLVGGISKARKLPTPLKYETLDPAQASPPMLLRTRFVARPGALLRSQTDLLQVCLERTDKTESRACLEEPTLRVNAKGFAAPASYAVLGSEVRVDEYAPSAELEGRKVKVTALKPFEEKRFSVLTVQKMQYATVVEEKHHLVQPRP